MRSDLVLALDASNRWVALGLFGPGVEKEIVVEAERDSFRVLAPLLDQILDNGTAKPDWIVCTTGPGSFTGVRLCVATGRDLSQFLGIPALGVDSISLYAATAAVLTPDHPVCVMIDGKQSRVYTKTIPAGADAQRIESIPSEDLPPHEVLAGLPENCRIFTDAPHAVRSYLEKHGASAGNPDILPGFRSRLEKLTAPSPRILAEMGRSLGGPDAARGWEHLLPRYLRNEPAHAKHPDGLKTK